MKTTKQKKNGKERKKKQLKSIKVNNKQNNWKCKALALAK